MNEQNKDIKLEIITSIDNDIYNVVKTIETFMCQDFENESDLLTGQEKIAILLLSLGSEISAKIFNKLTMEKIKMLVLEIANISIVMPETKEKILYEFYNSYKAQQYIAEGGISFARSILEQAFGEEKAYEIIDKLTASITVRPFDFMSKLSDSLIFEIIKDETMEVVSLILSQLRLKQASAILNDLSINQQLEIINYLGSTKNINLSEIKEIEKRLEKKADLFMQNEYMYLDGVDTIVEILGCLTIENEKMILESLESTNRQLYNEINDKLFVFEDILVLTNDDVKKIISSKDIYDEDIIFSLKGACDEIKSHILNNILGERKVIIEYRLENLGLVYKKNVIDARQKIVEIIRKLRNENEIFIPRGLGDEIIY